MVDSAVLAAIITGASGTAVGSIGAAWLTSRAGKGAARAQAADLITGAAGRMVDRLEKDNARLREAVLLLADILDSVPELRANPDVVAKLAQARRAAELAV